VLAAAVGVSVAAIALVQIDESRPIATSVCEITAHPKRFNGRLVQVRAKLVSGNRRTDLKDVHCSAVLMVDVDRAVFSGQRGQFAFIPDTDVAAASTDASSLPQNLEWKWIHEPEPIHLRQDPAYWEMVRHLNEVNTKYDVTATVSGRFDYLESDLVAIREKPGAKAEVHGVGFGHSYYDVELSRLAVESVSKVTATPVAR